MGECFSHGDSSELLFIDLCILSFLSSPCLPSLQYWHHTAKVYFQVSNYHISLLYSKTNPIILSKVSLLFSSFCCSHHFSCINLFFPQWKQKKNMEDKWEPGSGRSCSFSPALSCTTVQSSSPLFFVFIHLYSSELYIAMRSVFKSQLSALYTFLIYRLI